MDLTLGLSYLYALTLTFFTLAIAFRLNNSYPLRYVQLYLVYLVLFSIQEVLNILGRYTAIILFQGLLSEPTLLANHIFAFITLPFLFAALYFFAVFLADLVETRTPVILKRVYFVLVTVLFLVHVLITKDYFETQAPAASRTFSAILNYAFGSAYVLISLIMFFRALKLNDAERKKAAKALTLAYLAGAMILTYLPSRPFYELLPWLRPILAVFIVFTFNFPPLLILRRYLMKHASAPAVYLGDDLKIERFFAQTGLSEREGEVVKLLLQGKSNRDIVKELYISLHTVKNHIYNIYQKLGVKNRMQIVRLLKEFQEKR